MKSIRKNVISISMENTKMGPIPSFSLMPKITCNKYAPCVKSGCYAMKIARLRKTVSSAWERNTDIVMNDLDLFKKQMNGWLSIYQPKAFRIHVGGDFVNAKYLLAWKEIAANNPRVKFFAFTKQWNVLRETLCRRDSPVELPKNLSIILSAWTPDKNNWCPPPDLAKMFPIAWIKRNKKSLCDLNACIETMKMMRNGHYRYTPCMGHCSECGRCFNLKRKDGDILFDYH